MNCEEQKCCPQQPEQEQEPIQEPVVEPLEEEMAEEKLQEMENMEQSEIDFINALRIQAMQNAIESANMVSKQAIRHGDLAIDRQWNVDEVAHLIVNTSVFKDAIAAGVAVAVNEILANKE